MIEALNAGDTDTGKSWVFERDGRGFLSVTGTCDMEDGSKASAEERMPIGVDSPSTVWHIVVNDLQEGDESDHGKTAQETGLGGVHCVLRETPTVVRIQCIHMANIRVDEDVKARLEALKREDETFSDLLDRLSRSEKDVTEMAGFLEEFDDGHLEDDVREARESLNESLESR